jgi:hypothetical protein
MNTLLYFLVWHNFAYTCSMIEYKVASKLRLEKRGQIVSK